MRTRRRVILTLLCVLFIGLSLSYRVNAASHKETEKRTIAIVYDNSGSMFQNNAAWCQAQYAMEIFASMMNQDDKLMIYPMWPITVGIPGNTAQDNSAQEYYYQKYIFTGVNAKGKPQYEPEQDAKGNVVTNPRPLVITKDSQTSDIRNIASNLGPGHDTPVEAIDEAAKGLRAESGEKWLIVLTDGAVFYENGEKKGKAGETVNMLSKRFDKYIGDTNILYLGIGDIKEIPSVKDSKGNQYEARTAKSEQVPAVLTELCNLIFGRDALPDENHSENSVEFDIPLSKLYIFIQGENISDVKLTNGSTTLKSVTSSQPSYGELGFYNRVYDGKEFKVDKSLKGFIAVYENVDAGTYKYTYSGKSKSVQYYYEPDADLAVEMVDASGAPVKAGTELIPGAVYKLKYYLADKNGKALESKLFKETHYEFTYTLNGETKTEQADKAGEYEFSFGPTDSFSLDKVRVEFLSGYQIEKSGDKLGALAGSFKVGKETATDFHMEVSGGETAYFMDHVEGVYHVSMFKDGEQLKGDELKNVKLDAAISNGLLCRTEETADGFDVFVSAPEDLKQVQTGAGTIQLDAEYSSETVNPISSAKTIPFEVSKISFNDFHMAVSGGKDQYEADKIDGVYHVSFLQEGQAISGADLQNIEFSASVSNGVLCETKATDTGYDVILSSPADLSALTVGEAVLKMTASYASESVEKVTAESQLAFTLTDVSTKIALKILNGVSYYSISELKEFSGFIAELQEEGEPLSEGQLSGMELKAEAGGIVMLTERIAGTKQFLIKVDPDQSIETGKYTLKATLTGVTDRMGNNLTAEATKNFEVGKIPIWMRWLIIGAGILLLALLVLFILTRPALPKKISASGQVQIGGIISPTIKAACTYSRHGLAKGDLSVFAKLPSGKVGFRAKLVAAKGSYLMTPSKNRRAEVVPSSVAKIQDVSDLFINKKFVADGKGKLAPLQPLKNNFGLPKTVNFSGKKNINGKPSNFTVNATLKFK